jgi:hypothetical protein
LHRLPRSVNRPGKGHRAIIREFQEKAKSGNSHLVAANEGIEYNPASQIKLDEESLLLPDPPFFSSTPLVGWMVAAVAAIVVVSIVLKVVRKAVRLSIRLAILIGVAVIAAAALCWMSFAFSGGRLPIP